MKLIIPTHHSRAIQRISDALTKYAPAGSEIARPETIRKDVHRSRPIQAESEGDVLVMLVNGLHDHFVYQAERCKRRGQKYVVIQIALRTTRQPKTQQWRDLWSGASMVWSYYPLEQWIAEDGDRSIDFNFYHAPLGVDASVFTPEPAEARPYTILTSGQRRNQESVMESDDAAHMIGGKLIQLGPTYNMRSPTKFLTGISDEELAGWYRKCQWVSGLRRHEGFELPAAEGLLCGARPVLFNKYHYRYWYGDFADYIEETNQDQITHDLAKLFRAGARPVTPEERQHAVDRFNWEWIATKFWQRCL